jgi:uncharacterized membrane protein
MRQRSISQLEWPRLPAALWPRRDSNKDVTFEPLLNAPLAVQAHVATLVPAFLLGIWLIIFSRKGSRWHRKIGVIYLTLMTATALISLFIHIRAPQSRFFGFSPTHLFIPFTLFMVYRAIATVRAGNIKGHAAAMRGLFVGALVINGLDIVFFRPGITHDVLFPAARAAVSWIR